MSISVQIDIERVIARYEERRDQREPRLRRFLENDGVDFLVIQHPPGDVWTRCNNVEQIYANNVCFVSDCLQVDATDDLPFLSPWIGTGVYANAFGCKYIFRENDAPHVSYRYNRIEETRGIPYPDWRESPILRMVIDCIECYKERTRERLPICLTDTQSPFDTATLICDACDVFASCYENEELLMDFMQKITDLVIEFSRVQLDVIGSDLAAMPGHQFPSLPGAPGFSLSDDNLSVSSPAINRKIALPFDQQIGEAMGGAMVHSCGNWAHTIAILAKMPHIMGVECAIGAGNSDPSANIATEVRDALIGSGLYAKVRPDMDIDKALATLDDIAHPDLRLVVALAYDPENADRNYRLVQDRLARIYE